MNLKRTLLVCGLTATIALLIFSYPSGATHNDRQLQKPGVQDEPTVTGQRVQAQSSDAELRKHLRRYGDTNGS